MTVCIVAGSRDITSRAFVRREMIRMWKDYGAFTVLTGGARGVDSLAHQVALKAQQPAQVMHALWDKYGRSAGYRRNEEMAKQADMLLALWDGSSRGTKHMIDLAQKYKLTVRVVQQKEKNSG